MGVLSSIESIVNIANTATNMASTINQLQSGGLLKGINLNNITPSEINGIANQITTNCQSSATMLTSGLDSYVNVSDIENLAKNIKPEDVGINTDDIFKDLKNVPGFDPSILNGIEFK